MPQSKKGSGEHMVERTVIIEDAALGYRSLDDYHIERLCGNETRSEMMQNRRGWL
jgi:hypothetical protein